MRIQFYRSSLCPRCLLVSRQLARLSREYGDLEVEEIEVITSPVKSWQEGVRLIPALRAGDKRLSGLVLTPAQVRDFITALYEG